MLLGRGYQSIQDSFDMTIICLIEALAMYTV